MTAGSDPQRIGLGQPVEGHQAGNQRGHLVQRDHVRPVRRRAVGVFVRLDEDARRCQG